MMMFACPLGKCSKNTKKAPQISNILNNDTIDLAKINKLLTKITELKENNDIIKDNVYNGLEIFNGIDKKIL